MNIRESNWILIVAVAATVGLAAASCSSTPAETSGAGAGATGSSGVGGASSSSTSTSTSSSTSSGTSSGAGGSGAACQSDADCANQLPATKPPSCAEAKCDVVAQKCHFPAKDADKDGHPAKDCVAVGTGMIEVGDDCNDADPKIHPGAWDGPVGDGNPNACDKVDNDCDGTIDNGKLQNGGTCICTPGVDTRTCDKDSTLPQNQGTCAAGIEACTPDAKWGSCSIAPAAADTCVLGNDDNCNGVKNEGCPCIDMTTQACGACLDGTQTCASSAWGACIGGQQDFGKVCGSCGGTIACGGACTIVTPANYGQGCGACGGTIQCNGLCSVIDPPNVNQACGSCGGVWTCGGTCSVATPGNWNQGCGNCGGVWTCGGTCSIDNPANYGQPCGECGGKYDCNAQCPAPSVKICPTDWPFMNPVGGLCTLVDNVAVNEQQTDCDYPTPGQYMETKAFLYNTHGQTVYSDVTMSYASGGCFCNATLAIDFNGLKLTQQDSGCNAFPGPKTWSGYDLGSSVDLHRLTGWTPAFNACCAKHITMNMWVKIPSQCSW